MSTFRARRGFCGIFTLSILAATTALTAVPAAAETIGITSAVNLNAVGTPPAQDTRVLQVGLDMFANEKVDTGQVGQTHLIFDDGSALTIGPNSSVVLDEFVYDPQAQSGKLVVSVGKGLMRYVGGKISKKTPVLFKTPSSVIGIRGGIALIEANTPGQVGAAQDQGRDAPLSSVTLIYGKDAFLQSGDRTERMIRPGSQIVQQLDGSVLPPAPVPPGVLQNALNRLDEKGDADPGELVTALGASPQALAQIAPAAGPSIGDDDIADSQLADLSSDNDPDRLVPTTLNLEPIDLVDPLDPFTQQAGSGSNIIPQDSSTSISFSGETTGAIKRAANPEFGAGFVDPAGFFPFASVSSLDGATFNGALLSGGDLILPIGSGTFEATSTAQPFGATPLEGIGILSDSGDFLFYELEDPSDGSRVLAFAGNPTLPDAFPTAGVTAYELRDDFALGGVQIPFISPFQEFGLIDAGQTPTAYINWNSSDSSLQEPVFPAVYASTIVISGQGTAQTSVASVIAGIVVDDTFGIEQRFIFGGFRGSASDTFETTGYVGTAFSGVIDVNESGFFGQAGPENFVLQSVGNVVSPPDGEDIPYGANAVASLIDAGDAGSQQSDRVINGFFNGFSREFDAGGNVSAIRIITNANNPNTQNADPFALSIDTDPEFNVVSVDILTGQIGPNPGATFLTFGGFTQSAYIDDRRFAALEPLDANSYNTPLDTTVDQAEFAYVVTADQVTFDGALPPGVTICDCAFATWGFMALGVDFEGDQSAEIHLLPWVAGDIANELNQFPTAGTATYEGTVVGTTVLGELSNPNATLHKAFGNITLNFDFGAPEPLVDGTIANYDGGTIALVPRMLNPQQLPNFSFEVDASNSAIPGVFAINDSLSNGTGAFTGTGTPPENAIGAGRIVGSLSSNTEVLDYNSNFVLFTETDGLNPPGP